MNPVENKMNTEMNTEINTPVVVAKATETKKVKVIRQKKTDATEKSSLKKSTELEVEDEVVAENVEEVKPTNTEKIIEKIDPVVDAVEDAVEDTTEEVDEEVDKLEALRRQQLAIAKQIELIETQNKVKKNITTMRKTLIDNRTAEIERLMKTIQDKELELAALKDLDDDELMDTISGNEKLETELGLNRPVKKATAKKPAAAKKVINNDDISSISSNDSKKRKPVKYDRDTQFAEMPTGMEMFIQYKGHKETFIKIEDGVRAEDGLIHRNLNQAGRAFYASIGADKVSFNAWAEFKVMVNGKKVAVGDL